MSDDADRAREMLDKARLNNRSELMPRARFVRSVSGTMSADIAARWLQATVEETIVEASTKNSPTGQRMLTKPYPKDNEPRTLGLPEDLVTQLADRIDQRRLGPGDLLFATREGTPISRNTFRTRVWRPAVAASGVDFDVRVHDLRHAHASWLLAGGSDLKSVMDRMGHAQITNTQNYLQHPPRRPLQEPHRTMICWPPPARDRTRPTE